MFRSKSEVIIANMLIDNGLDDFLYEEKLPIGDTYKLPDFTFKDAATGTLVIWEHCGMMTDPVYRERWENKKKLYELKLLIRSFPPYTYAHALNNSLQLRQIQHFFTKSEKSFF